MKILFITSISPFDSLTGPFTGGAERAMRCIAEELTRRGHTVHFLTKADGPQRTVEVNGMSVHLVPLTFLSSKTNRSRIDKLVDMALTLVVLLLEPCRTQSQWTRRTFNRIRRIAIRESHASWPLKNKVVEIVGEHGIELIHAYSSFPEALVASIAGDELHLPVVLRMGGRSWYLRHQRIGKGRRSNYHDQLRYVFDTVDCLAFNSPALKEHTSELFQELKIRPTPNQPVLDIGVRVPTGVDRASDPFAELVTADRLVLACIGKFKRDSKRQDLLVRAIKLLGDEFPLTIIFAGDGPNRAKVEMLARTEGVGEHAVFLGNITHGSVFRLLQGSDMVLHPSEFEGSSKAIAEAMLYGKPVIASDIPSIREHIQDGVTGILAENSAASFADKIRELVLRPALRERIGNNARAYATQQFDPRRNVVMYEELFLTLVNRSKRRPRAHALDEKNRPRSLVDNNN